MTTKNGGPRTPEGKAISSRNAIKHGVTSNELYVLQNENPEAWAQLLAEANEEFHPETPFESQIVEEIAFAKWRLRRSWHIERALFNNQMEEQADTLESRFDKIDEGSRQGHAYKALSDHSTSITNLGRYQTRLERAYDRNVRNLRELRAAREQKNAKRTRAHSQLPKAPVTTNIAPPPGELPSDFTRIT